MTPKLLLASLFVLFSISGRVFCQSNPAAYRPVIAIQLDDLAGVSKPVLDRAKTVLTDVYARSADRALGIVLGYLLAHEIGHVLLPDGKHSAFGIMSAHLFATGEQWHNAMQGSLFFQSGQPAVLRNGALARAYGDQARTLRR